MAFPALCILLLALPGVLFRKAYARASVPIPLFAGDGSSKYLVNKYPVSVRPFSEEICLSLVWSIMLHVAWLTAMGLILSLFPAGASRLGIRQPDYQKILTVMHGPGNFAPEAYTATIEEVAKDHAAIVKYFLSLYAFSFIVGRTSLWVVRGFRLDHRSFLFRLEDQWFYFLRGEIFNFVEHEPFMARPRPQICGTYVSLVVPQSGGDFLYKGFLWDFHLDSTGNLDRLVLHHVIRSVFPPQVPDNANEDGASAESPTRPVVSTPAAPIREEPLISGSKSAYQTVTSQLFTVRYADCKTLACTYFYIRRRKKVAQNNSPATGPTGSKDIAEGPAP